MGEYAEEQAYPSIPPPPAVPLTRTTPNTRPTKVANEGSTKVTRMLHVDFRMLICWSMPCVPKPLLLVHQAKRSSASFVQPATSSQTRYLEERAEKRESYHLSQLLSLIQSTIRSRPVRTWLQHRARDVSIGSRDGGGEPEREDQLTPRELGDKSLGEKLRERNLVLRRPLYPASARGPSAVFPSKAGKNTGQRSRLT